MRVSVDQIKAARALLGWTQKDLALSAKVNKDTIANIEAERNAPQQDTFNKVLGAIELAGIEFLEDGVRKPPIKSLVIDKSDPNWFFDFLDDVIATLKDNQTPELIIYGVDDSLTKPQAIDRFRELRHMNVQMRFFIKEGNTFMRGDESEYRYIPEKLFLNYNSFVYGNKVLHDMDGYSLLVINRELANSERNKLNVLWDKCDPVTERSTADVRY